MNNEFLKHYEESLSRFNYLKEEISNLSEFSGDDDSIKLFKEYSALKQIISIYSS